MEAVLCADNLTKYYPEKKALDGLTLKLPKGRMIGLLGPNGSGKTTFLKLAAGLLTPTSGQLTVCGNSIGVASKNLVSYLPDRFCFCQERRIQEQVDYMQDFFPDFDRVRAQAMLKDLGLDPSAKLKSLSKGNQEKVQLVLAMSRRAKLYLLDEPIGGVDPAAREYILDTILQNYDSEATVLISTHLISDVERILDDVIFLKEGKIILSGNADAIREKEGKSLDELFREVFACSEHC